MLKAVCWGFYFCVFVQSIAGKSIYFNSGFKDTVDKSTHLQPEERGKEQIEDVNLSNGVLGVLCRNSRVPFDLQKEAYFKCIQQFLNDSRNIKLAKRSIDSAVSDQLDIAHDEMTHEVGKPTELSPTEKSDEVVVPVENSNDIQSIPTAEAIELDIAHDAMTHEEGKPTEMSPTEKSDEVVVPVEKSNDIQSIPTAEAIENEEHKRTDTLSEELVPAEIASESGSNIPSPVNETTSEKSASTKKLSEPDNEHGAISHEAPTEVSATAKKSDELIVPVEGPTDIQSTSNAEEMAASNKNLNTTSEKEDTTNTKTLSDELIIPAEIPAETVSNIPSVSETPSEKSTTKKLSEGNDTPTKTADEIPSDIPSSSANRTKDNTLVNINLLAQQTDLVKLSGNTEKILNSEKSSDHTVLSVDLSTDTPVLFKNGFDDILKNVPGKQHNSSIKEGLQGTVGSGQTQTQLKDASKNNSLHNVESGEISKAGESQEKTSSSPNNILLIVFAILGVVGTLAFAFNYIKKRREDREVNEMIKLEEEGKELKEIKPLMKSNFVQNGSKSLEYIDADPQLQVDTESKAETN